MTVGRVLRYQDGEWRPIGEPLPAFEHAPPTPQLLLAPWVLPRDLEVEALDVVVVGELAHQLVGRCTPDDPAVQQLAQQTMLFHGAEAAATWLSQVEVWMGHRRDPGRPWLTPKPGR
jgi:hypothetical protein